MNSEKADLHRLKLLLKSHSSGGNVTSINELGSRYKDVFQKRKLIRSSTNIAPLQVDVNAVEIIQYENFTEVVKNFKPVV